MLGGGEPESKEKPNLSSPGAAHGRLVADG